MESLRAPRALAAKAKHRKRYAMQGEIIKAAGSKPLGSWKWTDDTKTNVRFCPKKKIPTSEWAVYLFIVDNKRFHPYYVGATTDLKKRMNSNGKVRHQKKIHDKVQDLMAAGHRVRVDYYVPKHRFVPWAECPTLKLSVIHGLEVGIVKGGKKPEWNAEFGTPKAEKDTAF